ncbi:MAG: XdhC family protein [Chryseobacterium sp.]|nr:XdhC family protein [Chryseobacterium sp.]
MTHEFKKILAVSKAWKERGVFSVLATVVDLQGSSYRRAGVRMLISEFGEMEGAVSGGCVEKEILLQSKSVFKTGVPIMMTYDGRLRLGCEGVLYILLEPFDISEILLKRIEKAFKNRESFRTQSFFKADFSENHDFGTIIEINGNKYPLRSSFSLNKTKNLQIFQQEFKPIFQLYIFGAEHDAVQLCNLASIIGWEVHIIAPPDEQKIIDYFPGATNLLSPLIDKIDVSAVGRNTAVVLMSHNLNKDLQYLIALKDTEPIYLGLLGPSKRREYLLSELLNYFPDTPFDFFERIHGPAGLNIGAESAPEIALSIIAEILSVTRNAELMQLKDKSGKIHD